MSRTFAAHPKPFTSHPKSTGQPKKRTWLAAVAGGACAKHTREERIIQAGKPARQVSELTVGALHGILGSLIAVSPSFGLQEIAVLQHNVRQVA